MAIASSCQYLLILACSQRKRHDVELLSAIERYDGGHFRVLRKAKRLIHQENNTHILVLSAKYGLIDASTLIADYEQRMTPQRAQELNIKVMDKLRSYIKSNKYCEVYIDLGKDYQAAIAGTEQLFDGLRVIYAQGRIGERLQQLKNWLEKISTKEIQQRC